MLVYVCCGIIAILIILNIIMAKMIRDLNIAVSLAIEDIGIIKRIVVADHVDVLRIKYKLNMVSGEDTKKDEQSKHK